MQFSFGQMFVGGDTLLGNEWIDYDLSYHKFSVEQDAVCRIRKRTLEASGIPANEINGANFRMYNMGRQVPLFVSTNGVFGNDDFRRRNYSTYPRENRRYYWYSFIVPCIVDMFYLFINLCFCGDKNFKETEYCY